MVRKDMVKGQRGRSILDTWVPGKAGKDLPNRMMAGREGEGNTEKRLGTRRLLQNHH